MYVRLFSYARYLNQKGLDETYTDAFGNVKTVRCARTSSCTSSSCRSPGGS